MSEQYKCLPSELLGIEDTYTAFCFNEAVNLITQHLKNGDKPNYSVGNKEKIKNKEYNRPSDLYKDLDLE